MSEDDLGSNRERKERKEERNEGEKVVSNVDSQEDQRYSVSDRMPARGHNDRIENICVMNRLMWVIHAHNTVFKGLPCPSCSNKNRVFHARE